MFSTEFLLTSLVVVLIPGTGVIYTISNGLFLGRKASIAAAAGCTAGIIPHLTASILGLSANLVRSRVAGSPKLILILQRSFAAVFAAMGIKLAMTSR